MQQSIEALALEGIERHIGQLDAELAIVSDMIKTLERILGSEKGKCL